MPSPIGLELFQFVEDAANEISTSDELSDELDPEDGLLLFVRDFYLQFFENVLNAPITSIGSKSAQRANQLMRSKKKPENESARALIRRFQRLCKIYPELLGEQYESGDAIDEFQRDFVLDMLEEVVAWAHTAEENEIETRASEAREALTLAVADVPLT